MATSEISIAHVTVEVRRPERWRTLLDTLTRGNARWDDADSAPTGRHALRVRQGRKNDIVLLGLAFADSDALDAAIRRCAAAGIACTDVEPPAGALRAVHCHDPAGLPLELLVLAKPRVRDERWPLAHVALCHRDPALLEDFYANVIGFRCNERLAAKAGPLDLRGSFLGSAVRHHTIAVLSVPSRRRLHHLMFAAPDVSHVLEAWHRARSAGIALSMDLGRHTLPDGTTSFYAAGPSGFDIEIGSGGNVLDGGELLEIPQSSSGSSWGHELSVRARLRVMAAMLLGAT